MSSGTGNWNFVGGGTSGTGNWNFTGGSNVTATQIDMLSDCCHEPPVENNGKKYCSGCNKEFYMPEQLDWREYERLKKALDNAKDNAIQKGIGFLNSNGTI